MIRTLLILPVLLLLISCGNRADTPVDNSAPEPDADADVESQWLPVELRTLTVASDAFAEGAAIPDRHSRSHDNLTPPLQWSGAPTATAAFAIICDDPDAPTKTWVHWTAWNLSGELVSLAEGVTPADNRFVQGTSDFGSIGYGGPQPPSGTHRYRFTVIALREPLALEAGATPAELRAAVESRALAWGVVTGTYAKQ